MIGLGGGIIDRAREVLEYWSEQAKANSGTERATDPKRFANKRAEAYWRSREAFKSQQFMIPDHDQLVQELTSLTHKVVNSNGTIRMEEKKEAKRRLGKMPGLADSLMLTDITKEEQQEASRAVC